MINKTVVQLINEFEKKFSAVLKPPSQKHRDKHFYTEFFKIRNHMVKEKQKFSDWDLYCWLKPEVVTTEDLKAIDKFLRDDFEGLSGTELFSLPGRDGRDEEDALQYMSFMPTESWAPFLDFHVKGPIQKDVWAPTYRGDEEHLRGAILTGWRKIKNGNIEGGTGARKHYRDQIEQYIPEEERIEDRFVDESRIAKYYGDTFQDERNKNALAFLA